MFLFLLSSESVFDEVKVNQLFRNDHQRSTLPLSLSVATERTVPLDFVFPLERHPDAGRRDLPLRDRPGRQEPQNRAVVPAGGRTADGNEAVVPVREDRRSGKAFGRRRGRRISKKAAANAAAFSISLDKHSRLMTND